MLDDIIKAIKEEHLSGLRALLGQGEIIKHVADMIVSALRDGRKVLIAGNGGSAADSQHFAAELVGRFERERGAFSAIALTTDTSILTAVGNDYGFGEVFRRQVVGLGRAGDIFIGISTSGNSENVIRATETAKGLGLVTVSFTGRDGGRLRDISNYNINIPLKRTARIQELHIILIHLLCELIENALTEQGTPEKASC